MLRSRKLNNLIYRKSAGTVPNLYRCNKKGEADPSEKHGCTLCKDDLQHESDIGLPVKQQPIIQQMVSVCFPIY